MRPLIDIRLRQLLRYSFLHFRPSVLLLPRRLVVFTCLYCAQFLSPPLFRRLLRIQVHGYAQMDKISLFFQLIFCFKNWSPNMFVNVLFQVLFACECKPLPAWCLGASTFGICWVFASPVVLFGLWVLWIEVLEVSWCMHWFVGIHFSQCSSTGILDGEGRALV